MNSVQKSEHEKNLEHSKKRSRPSLLRPVSAPAKVTVTFAHRCPHMWAPDSLVLGSRWPREQYAEAPSSRPWEWTLV